MPPLRNVIGDPVSVRFRRNDFGVWLLSVFWLNDQRLIEGIVVEGPLSET